MNQQKMSNTDIMNRISQLKESISAIDQSITKKNYKNALGIITNIKKSINSNIQQQNPNIFILDCLKAKNQKLKAELNQQKNEEKIYNEKLQNSLKGYDKGIAPIQTKLFISRFSISLEDINKIDFDEATISSDYKILFINSWTSTKYENYELSINQFISMEQKENFIHFNCLNQKGQENFCIIKMENDKDAIKWYYCLKFAQMIQFNKNKKKLFMKEQKISLAPTLPFTSSDTEISKILQLQKNQSSGVDPETIQASQKDKNVDKSFERLLERSDKYQKPYDKYLSQLGKKKNSLKGKAIKNENNRKPNKVYQVRIQGNRPTQLEVKAVKLKQGNSMAKSTKTLNKVKSDLQFLKQMKEIDQAQKKEEKKSRGQVSQKKYQQLQKIQRDDILNIKQVKFFNQKSKTKSKQKEKLSQKDLLEINTYSPIKNYLNVNPQKRKRFNSESNHDIKERFESRKISDQIHLLNPITINPRQSNYPQQEDDKSQEIRKKQESNYSIRSKRITEKQMQRQKFLNQNSSDFVFQRQNTPPRSNTNYESINWEIKQNIVQQVQDEHLSKSSKTKSFRQKSDMSISEKAYKKSSNGSQYYDHQTNSKHIISEDPQIQDISPTFEKEVVYEVPSENKQSGITINLIPTDKEEINISEQPTDKEQSQQSEDSDTVHGNASSHGNTQSEDNAERIEQLKKGIILTKCAEDGFWPHQKILYLSENQSQLCYRQLKDKKVKKIKIDNIQSVQYRKYGKGIIKHIDKAELKEQKCMMIKALAEGKMIKNYEFVGKLAENLERFADSLKQFVEFNKKI